MCNYLWDLEFLDESYVAPKQQKILYLNKYSFPPRLQEEILLKTRFPQYFSICDQSRQLGQGGFEHVKFERLKLEIYESFEIWF
jgi:hypothetical protein